MLLSLLHLAWAVSPSALGDVTVTEFQADTETVPAYWGEWLEIYNNSGTTLDMNGIEVVLGSGDTYTIIGARPVGVEDFLVLGADMDKDLNGNVDIDVQYSFPDFNISGPDDSIELLFDGVRLDIVDWDSTWAIVKDEAESCAPNASSLEWANDLQVNWCPSATFIEKSGMKGSPGEANDYCNASPPGVDNDGDTYTEAEGDCDDTDPDVNPGSIDGNSSPYGDANDDSDCDSVRDDGITDDDEDGWTEVQGDCDDGDAGTYPGAIEQPDEEDDDCNGCVDDVDIDRDGYSDCIELEVRDCVEGDKNINPDATEIPYDGEDQDCDGLDDDCDLDGDGRAATSDYGPGCDGSDCDDGNADVFPGAIEDPANGVDDNCDGEIDIPDRDGDGITREDGDCMDIGEESGADAALVGLSASVNPDMPEVCGDLVDNDCNGFIDDLVTCGNGPADGMVRGGGICGVASAPAGAGLLLGLALVALSRRKTAEAP